MRRQILAELVWRGTITPATADELLVGLEAHVGNPVDHLLGRGLDRGEVLAAASTAAGLPLAPPNRVKEPRPAQIDLELCLAVGGIPIGQRGSLPCVVWADPERAVRARDSLPEHISMLSSSRLWSTARAALVPQLGFSESNAPPTVYGISGSGEQLRSGAGLLADDMDVEDEAVAFDTEATRTDTERLAGVQPTSRSEASDSVSLKEPQEAPLVPPEREATTRIRLDDEEITSFEEEESGEIKSFEDAPTLVSVAGGTESYSNLRSRDGQRSGERSRSDHEMFPDIHTELEEETSYTASAPPMSAESAPSGPAIAPVPARNTSRAADGARASSTSSGPVDGHDLEMPPGTLILSGPDDDVSSEGISSVEDEAHAFEALSSEDAGVGPDWIEPGSDADRLSATQPPIGQFLDQVRARAQELVLRGESLIAPRPGRPSFEARPSADRPAVTRWAVNPEDTASGAGGATEHDEPNPSEWEQEQ